MDCKIGCSEKVSISYCKFGVYFKMSSIPTFLKNFSTVYGLFILILNYKTLTKKNNISVALGIAVSILC